MNLTDEKLSIHCKMFGKLDVRRKLVVTLALSQNNRKIVVRYFVNRAWELLSSITHCAAVDVARRAVPLR